jgi:predicted RecB family nuclease
VTWEALSPGREASLFAQFWDWLGQLRSSAAETGLQLRAYCYNASAENGQMRRVASVLGLGDEVDAFIASAEWVDLMKVFESQLATGSSVGLKKAAPLSGFAWEVDDPGGDVSMLYYETAVDNSDPTAAATGRAWLLTYNRNDCEATAALRSWLSTAASACPPIESLGN